MCERERERKTECKCYPFLIISVKARGIYELMLLGKCSRPKQKWTHNSIPLKVPSELSGRGSLSGRVLRTRSPPPLLSAAHGREQGCMEGTELPIAAFGEGICTSCFPSLAQHLHEKAAFSRSHPGIANHPKKQKHGAQCRMGQLSAVPGKHTKLGTKEQLKLHGKN